MGGVSDVSERANERVRRRALGRCCCHFFSFKRFCGLDLLWVEYSMKASE